MSVAWFDGVTLTVEVAFTTTPLGAPTWTDVSDYVRGIDINRGRSDEFSTFGPGTLSVTFSNADRRFDPEHGASPYAPNLLPMKRIRVRATYSSVTYDLFVGFVQGWPQSYVWTFDSTVTVEAVDGSRFLESSELQRSAYEAAVLADGPSHYWPLQEQNTTASASYGNSVGIPSLYFSSAPATTGVAPMAGIPLPIESRVPQMVDVSLALELDANFNGLGSSTAANASATIPETERIHGVSVWFKPNGKQVGATYSGGVLAKSSPLTGFYIDLIRLSVNGVGAIQVQYSSALDGRYVFAQSVATVPTGQFSLIAAWYDGADLKLYVNGALAATVAVPVATPFAGDESGSASISVGSFSHFAVFGDVAEPDWQHHYLAGLTAFGHPFGERSGARVGRVLDEIGWPAGDRTLSTGDTVHGAYRPDRQSVMRYLRFVETAEDGLLFIGRDGKVTLRDRTWQWLNTSSATYSDDGSDIPYDDIEIDANSVEPLRNIVSNTYGPNDAYLKVSDDTSVTNYGPAQDTLSTPTLESALTARALAEYRLRRSSTPTSRITRMSVNPRAKPATAYPAVLALELGNRITVERTPQGVGSQIVKSLTVQGYSQRITREGEWMTSFYMSPAPDLATPVLTEDDAPILTEADEFILVGPENVSYFIVGDATYGQLGVAAGNQIPF